MTIFCPVGLKTVFDLLKVRIIEVQVTEVFFHKRSLGNFKGRDAFRSNSSARKTVFAEAKYATTEKYHTVICKSIHFMFNESIMCFVIAESDEYKKCLAKHLVPTESQQQWH